MMRLIFALFAVQFLTPVSTLPAQAKDSNSSLREFAYYGEWIAVTAEQLSGGDTVESFAVGDGMLVWTIVHGETRTLFLFDGATTRTLAVLDRELWDRDAENGFFDAVSGNYAVGGGQVVWVDRDSDGDREIFAFRAGEKREVTKNDYDDFHPVASSAGRIAWTSKPSDTTNLMLQEKDGSMRLLQSWHVQNYTFSGKNLYWLNKIPGEEWFRVFVDRGNGVVAIGKGDDRPMSEYFFTDGKGSAVWEYSTKQWDYDKRRIYRSYNGLNASLIVQRDVPPTVPYISDSNEENVIFSVHDMLTTMRTDYQFIISDGNTLKTLDHEIAPVKARFMDGGFVRHLVAENGSPLVFMKNDGSGMEYLSLTNVVYEMFDADGSAAAGALLGGGVVLFDGKKSEVISTEGEVVALSVVNGEVVWVERLENGDERVIFASLGMLVNGRDGVKRVTGSLVKISGFPAVYLYAVDGNRYVFPGEKEYFSWYEDFYRVFEFSYGSAAQPLGFLSDAPVAGTVLYAPGTRLLKVPSSPEVYAIDTEGILHWVTSSQVLREALSDDWETSLRDLPESFFVNYSVGVPIETTEEYCSVIGTPFWNC